jgi:hypothetical protein
MQSLLAKLALLLDGKWKLLAARTGQVEWLLPPWGPALLLGGGLAVVILAALCYRRTTEGLTGRNRLTLGVLRAVALGCLLVMASGAICTIRIAEGERPDLLVVVDDSPSMDLAQGGTARVAAAAEALDAGLRQQLEANRRVRVVTTSGRPLGEKREGAGAPQDLARALIRAAAQPSAGPLDQIVLISDGAQLGQDALAAAAVELPAPVNTLVVGDVKAIRDASVESVSVPPFTYTQDRAVAAVNVRSVGLDGEAMLRLFHVRGGGEKEIAASPIVLRPDNTPVLGRLEFQADTAGLQSYIVRLEPRPGELTDKNNSIRFHLDVREEKIHVLFVEGEPSWEYRYAKEALESDPAIEFCGLVRLPNTE